MTRKIIFTCIFPFLLKSSHLSLFVYLGLLCTAAVLTLAELFGRRRAH